MRVEADVNNVFDLEIAYLQAEMACIDVLLQRQVLRWQRAGQDPADAFRGLHATGADMTGLLARPLGSHWGQMVELDGAEEQALAEAAAAAIDYATALVDLAEQQGHTLRLRWLAERFGLSRFDLDMFLICLAPALDLRYERLYGFLQDDVTRRRPQVSLVLDLLCEPGPDRWQAMAHLAGSPPL
ncbi:MAG: hypothetical protein PVJ85_14845, partial [Anaerolineae bacterium]